MFTNYLYGYEKITSVIIEEYNVKFVARNGISKEVSNGMRMLGVSPLSQDEIDIVKKEIRRIKADESVFKSLSTNKGHDGHA